MKTCSKCKSVLPVTEFYADKRLKSGLNSWCKGCHVEIKTSTKVARSKARKEKWWVPGLPAIYRQTHSKP